MTWAPCLAASWAASSCFWIIDSLSPVQLACSSAPRTILGISALLGVRSMTVGRGRGRAYTGLHDARTARDGVAVQRGRLAKISVNWRPRPSGVELQQERVVVLAIAGRSSSYSDTPVATALSPSTTYGA